MCRYIIACCFALFYVGQFIDARPQFQPVQMPVACENKAYCTEKSEDYPEKVIESLLAGIGSHWQEVQNDTMPGKRQGMPNNECKYKSVIDPIHVMLDQSGNLRYVVQNKEKFNQIIYIEECLNPGPITDATNSLSKMDVDKHEFQCKQTYLDYQFVVLSLDGTKLESVKMQNKVPVCCACVLNKRENK